MTTDNCWSTVFPHNIATLNESKILENLQRRHEIAEIEGARTGRHPLDIRVPTRRKMRVGEHPKEIILGYHSQKDYSEIIKGFGDKPLYGLEIEIDRPRNSPTPKQTVKELYNLLERENGKFLNLVTLERDGSLGEEGVEIITAPLSQLELRLRYSAIHNILTQLTKWGWLSHDNHNCGLHISVSKGPGEADNHLDNIIMTGKGKEFAKVFSRRTDDQLRRYCSFESDRNNRYRAINQTNPARIELRFFRGTLKPTTFIACLEYTFAVRDFSLTYKDETFPAQKRWPFFIKFLKENKKRYAILEKYCVCSDKETLRDAFLPKKKLTKEEKVYSLLNVYKEQVKNILDHLHTQIERRGLDNYYINDTYKTFRVNLINTPDILNIGKLEDLIGLTHRTRYYGSNGTFFTVNMNCSTNKSDWSVSFNGSNALPENIRAEENPYAESSLSLISSLISTGEIPLATRSYIDLFNFPDEDDIDDDFSALMNTTPARSIDDRLPTDDEDDNDDEREYEDEGDEYPDSDEEVDEI